MAELLIMNNNITAESNEKVRDILVFVGDNEVKIEKMRQTLCKQSDFEPYSAFMRIDRS